VLGGVGGLLLAVFGTRVLPAMIPETLPVPRDFGIDGTVLLFTMAVTLLTGLLFGLIPALQASRSELNQLLGGRTGGSTARSRQRRRNALVVAEMALASVLLVCAGLMLRSMSGLLATDPGFDTDDLLTFRVALDAQYTRSEQTVAFQQQVLERIRASPGVVAAGVVDWLPMGGTNNFNNFRIEGGTGDRDENAGFVIATPGYLETMNIALVRGRFFEERDVAEAPGVVVVNEAMARRYWPDEDPLGKRLLASTDPDGAAWRTVIGVIGNVRHAGLASDPRPEMVVPFAQYGWPSGSMAFVVRTRQDPLALVESVQRSVWEVDAALPLYDVRTMHRVVRETNAVLLSRLTAGALALFGAVALLLSALGLYGVISFGVAQRTWEIGVRCALGAARSDVLRLVLRQGLSLVASGLAIGLLAAFGLTRLLGSMLHGVSPRDPASFIGVALALSAVALLATWLPARRAAGIDPATALRAE
jgi:putative ABC transport system permease protein